MFWDLRPERTTNKDQAVVVEGSISNLVKWLNNFTASKPVNHSGTVVDFDPNHKKLFVVVWNCRSLADNTRLIRFF